MTNQDSHRLSESLTLLIRTVRDGSRGMWARFPTPTGGAYRLENMGGNRLFICETGDIYEPDMPVWAIAGRLYHLGVR